MRNGTHHIHKRKRIHHLKHEFPSPDPRIRFLDNVCIVVGVIAPLTALTQIHKIWVLKNAIGVSLITWLACAILAVPMLIYGIVHRATPIIVLNILWIVMDTLVVAGVLMYG